MTTTGMVPPANDRVTFYGRTGESTFTTDPRKVAAAFLAHRLGKKATESVHNRRYLDAYLAEYLRWKGAGWARMGDSDPFRTRHAYDTVHACIVAQIAAQARTDPRERV